MKTYDCFPFFNEFDILELRLKTLSAHVDYFVIVESPWTYRGDPKPLHFKENHRRFSEWLPKIRHVVMGGFIDTDNPRVREAATRNSMLDGLYAADPDDIVFQSDCDEIWRPECKLEGLDEAPIVVFGQEIFYYYLNTRRVPRIGWYGSRRLRMRDWPEAGGYVIRLTKKPIIRDGGWHFSFLGKAESAREKLKSFCHSEYSGEEYASLERLREKIEAGEDPVDPGASYQPIEVDETFPRPVLEDPQRWADFIKPPGEHS